MCVSIHYGKFVAESKFLSEREAFTTAIRARDVATLTDFITKPIVEGQWQCSAAHRRLLSRAPPGN